MKRPICLLRCSTDKQDLDFAAQRASIQTYLDAKGLVVAPEDWREERAVSGARETDKRPVLARILEEAAVEKSVSALIVADFDRLGRAGEETLWIVRQLVDDCGVQVVIARCPGLDLTTFEGRCVLFAFAIGGLAKLEAVSKSTSAAFMRDLDGITVSRRHGKRVGRAPLEWPEGSAALLAGKRTADFQALAAAQTIACTRRVALDAQGRLCAKKDTPFASWGVETVFPTWRTLQRRAAELRRNR